MRPVWVALKCHCKHSIASEEYGINQVTFALQNIKIRLWQAVKILKGYWNFTIRSPRQVVFRQSPSARRTASFIPSLSVGTRTDIRSRFMRLILLIEMVQSQCRIQNCKALVAMLLKFPSRKMPDCPSRHCLQYS